MQFLDGKVSSSSSKDKILFGQRPVDPAIRLFEKLYKVGQNYGE